MKSALLLCWVCLVAVITCGNGSGIEEQIYNGYNAVRGQIPYIVLLLLQVETDGGFYNCGGSLISTQYVLTAAHCLASVNYTKVTLGIVDTEDSDGLVVEVLKPNLFVHPDYDRGTLANDLGIIKFPEPITTNEFIKAIALPKKSQADENTFNNVMATASGWGQTQDDEGSIHQYLQYWNIHVMNHSECAAELDDFTAGKICTDKKVVFAGPCPGDSGGPLATNGTQGEPILIGAVSYGVANCSADNPVTYSNVAYYLDWINNVTGIPIS